MICFRTHLHLKGQSTLLDVWKSFCAWRIESSNTSEALKAACKKHKDDLGVYNLVGSGKDSVETLFIEHEYFAIRYMLRQKSKCYSTSIVAKASQNRIELSFELEVNGDDGIIERYPFEKPKYFDYLKRFFGSTDYSENALCTSSIGVSTLSDYMQGKSLYLPLVYISRTKDGTYLINPDETAKKLFCIAFVCKEDSREIAEELKALTNGKNAHDGSIGVYWKDSYRVFRGANAETLFSKISAYLSYNSLPENLTWFFVQKKHAELHREAKKASDEKLKVEQATSEAIITELQDRIKRLEAERDIEMEERQRIEKEYKDYRETFEPELREIEEKIKQSENEKQSLKSQLEKWQCSTEKGDIQLNIKCSEKELFNSEIQSYLKGLLFKAWSEYKGKNTRKADVLSCLLIENADFDFEKSPSKEVYATTEKEIFNEKPLTYYKFISQNKHKKFQFFEDARYVLTKSTTPGDNKRAMKNLVSDAQQQHFLEP